MFVTSPQFEYINIRWWCSSLPLKLLTWCCCIFPKNWTVAIPCKCYTVLIYHYLWKQKYWLSNVSDCGSLPLFLTAFGLSISVLTATLYSSLQGTFHIVLLRSTAVFSSSILTHLRIAVPDFFWDRANIPNGFSFVFEKLKLNFGIYQFGSYVGFQQLSCKLPHLK